MIKARGFGPKYTWSNWLFSDAAKKLSNITYLGSNEFLDERLRANEFDSIIIDREAFYNAIGRRAFQKAINSRSRIAVFDNDNDPLILRCALDSNITYFKRELLRDVFSIEYQLHYGLSVYKYVKSHFFGLLMPAEAILAVLRERVKPFPMSISNQLDVSLVDGNQTCEKSYSVSMMASIKGGWGNLGGYIPKMTYVRERVSLARVLKNVPNSYVKIFGEGVKIPMSERITPEAYSKIIRESVCSVAPRGKGYDSARYWEIPAFGSVLIARRPKTIIPNNFVDGKEGFFFKNYKHLVEIVSMLNSDLQTAKKVAASGREKYLAYHSPEKRISYLINCMNN